MAVLAPSAAVATPARSPLITGLILGVGVAATLDEVLLHQLLQWHVLYVHTTEYWRTVIDGLLHLGSSTLLFLGALRLWSQRRALARLGDVRPLVAGILLGAGGFNLYDGTIQHKVLQLHPVREGVENPLPYDLAFIGIAVAALAADWLLWRAAKPAALDAEIHTGGAR